ncbi:hypothetical protein SDC9_44738 [bioreactor metagenome]|uniref:Uncharacterized protein n=1 Tax=bioreactor metagenome TaxID=1076179 RepID=A0A644W7H0_9ZZZZ
MVRRKGAVDPGHLHTEGLHPHRDGPSHVAEAYDAGLFPPQGHSRRSVDLSFEKLLPGTEKSFGQNQHVEERHLGDSLGVPRSDGGNIAGEDSPAGTGVEVDPLGPGPPLLDEFQRGCPGEQLVVNRHGPDDEHFRLRQGIPSVLRIGNENIVAREGSFQRFFQAEKFFSPKHHLHFCSSRPPAVPSFSLSREAKASWLWMLSLLATRMLYQVILSSASRSTATSRRTSSTKRGVL